MSCPGFGKGLDLVLMAAFPAAAPSSWTARTPPALGFGESLGCQKLAGQGDGLGGCATIRGGSWLDERDPSMKGLQEGDEWGVLLPPRMGMSRDGQTPHRWDNTYALTCTATLPRGLLPLFPASGPGEIKGGAMPESKGSLCPCVSHTWGSWRGQRPRPGATLHPGPGPGISRPESPGSGNTGRVCACVQVRVYVCAYFAHLSRDQQGWVGGGGQ